MQPFIDKHLNAKEKPKLPKKFSLVTMNPASSGSRGGLSVQQLEVPFQLGRLVVEKDIPRVGIWRVRTENVRRMQYKPVSGLSDRPQQLLIDDSIIPISVTDHSNNFSDHLNLCRSASLRIATTAAETGAVQWKICCRSGFRRKKEVEERGPDNSGPSAQVLAARRLMIIFPEGDRKLQDIAIAYSNSLYIRGVSAQVTTDSNFRRAQYENGHSRH